MQERLSSLVIVLSGFLDSIPLVDRHTHAPEQSMSTFTSFVISIQTRLQNSSNCESVLSALGTGLCAAVPKVGKSCMSSSVYGRRLAKPSSCSGREGRAWLRSWLPSGLSPCRIDSSAFFW